MFNNFKSNNYRSLTLAVTCLLALAAPLAAQVRYEAEVVEPPPAPDEFPFLSFTDINDNGIANYENFYCSTPDCSEPVGFFVFGFYNTKTGEFTQNSIEVINFATGESTLTGNPSYALNNAGDFVGGCTLVRASGEVIDLSERIGPGCSLRGIAPNDRMVGFISGGGTQEGFVYDLKKDRLTKFLRREAGDPGNESTGRSLHQAISARGYTAGGIDFNNRKAAIRDRKGNETIFQVVLNGEVQRSQARGINNSNTIAGNVLDPASNDFLGYVGHLSEVEDGVLVPDIILDKDLAPQCTGGYFITRINNKGEMTGICYFGTPFGFEQWKGIIFRPVHGN